MQMVMSIKSLLSSFRTTGNSHLIETLLSTEGVTLELLLDSDIELVQEVKMQNPSLLQYFSPAVISQLLTFILVEPSTDDLKVGHKFPFIACEVLKSGVPQILNQFFTEQALLDQLFEFLNGKQLNLTLAGYFSAVAEALLRHNSYELLSYIHETRDLGRVIVSHLGSTSVMEFLFRLMASEDHGNPAYLDKLGEIVEFTLRNFQETRPGTGFRSKVCNSARLLYMLVANHIESANWSHVQQALCDSPNADVLVNCALSCDVVLASAALSVLEACLNNLDVKASEDNIVSSELPDLLVLLLGRIDRICDILKAPKKELGMCRLSLIKTISSLFRLSYIEVKESLREKLLLKEMIVKNIQELVPRYSWNSLLHNAVCDTVSVVLLCDDLQLKHSVTPN
jgi:hypothetical protein